MLFRAWKSWKHAKGAAFLAIAALAAGIGSTTAIYAVVKQTLYRKAPYQDGERFVAIFSTNANEPKLRGAMTFPDLNKFKDRAQSFDAFGWLRYSEFNLSSPGTPQHLQGVEVTPDLVLSLGAEPIHGQWFRKPSDNAAVISYFLWQRLGGDPAIVGKLITLNGRGYVVTGIMGEKFLLPTVDTEGMTYRSEVWLPLDPAGRGESHLSQSLFGYARRKPGISHEQADADVKRVAAQIAAEEPASHPLFSARIDPLEGLFTDDMRSTLFLLFAATGLLLLISCANVAGLLLARSVVRARETAVRAALGASTIQLAVQYFLEGLVLSLTGGALGVLCSVLLLRGIASAYPVASHLTLDWTAMALSLAAAFASSALASLAPLWQAVRTPPAEALGDGLRSSASARSRVLSQSLVVGEIALAFTLLCVSGLLIDQLDRLRRVWPGFNPNGLLTFKLTVTDIRNARSFFYQESVIQALETVPGIRSAGFVNQIPLDGCCLSTSIYPEGRAFDPRMTERVSFMLASPGYLRTMGVPLMSGRFVHPRDIKDELLPAVINRTAALRYWPGQEALGAFGRLGGPKGSRFEVIGVVGDVRNAGLKEPPIPEIYLPAIIAPPNPFRFVVRSQLPAARLVPQIRQAIAKIDPGQPIYDVTTLGDILDQSLALSRASSLLMAFFAGSALIMAALGIYGLVSYSVRQRTVEIGTRMAMGAVRSDVLLMVVSSGMKLALYGIMIGAAALVLGNALLRDVLGASGFQVLPVVYSILAIGAISAAASLFPGWRATLLTPMVAMRDQDASLWQTARQNLTTRVPRQPAPVESMLSAFIEDARTASSFQEAMDRALETLRTRSGADWAKLVKPGSPELPFHGFLIRRLQHRSAPLPLEGADFEALLRWVTEHKPQHVEEATTLKDLGIRVAVPLRTHKDLLGAVLLGGPADARTLGNCGGEFALMMENALLTDRMLDEEKLRRDLDLAVEVQRRLLPQKVPVSQAAVFAAASIPARSIGGDYYDFLSAGEGRIGIAVADIAGKGVAAALLMSVVQASLRIVAGEGTPLPQMVAKLNRALQASTRSKGYATFFFALFDERTRELRYVNASHNPPYLVRGGSVEKLQRTGHVIGMFAQAQYQEVVLHLQPGDLLVAITDGVTEAMSAAQEEFGEDRLQKLLVAASAKPVEEVADTLLRELKDWMQDAPQHDDLTFVIMRVT